MPASVRRLALGLVLGGAVVAGGSAPAPVAAQGCDPSFPEICLAASPDLDWFAIGSTITVLHDAVSGASDPPGLDADFDGYGCEYIRWVSP
jgi:hypothetical protein